MQASGLARDARSESDRSADTGHRHVQFRKEQDRGANHRRVLYQRDSRDGRRHRALLGQAATGTSASWCGRKDERVQVHENYVALPASEAFRIEYWALEEAKIRRQPAEKELSRRVVLVVGGGAESGAQQRSSPLNAERHVVVADRDMDEAAISR